MNNRRPVRDIVLLGASRGGVVALLRITSALPAQFPAAVLVVLHQPPDGPRLLDELIGERSAIPVAYARDGDLIEHSRIYLAPPDHHLIVRRNLHLGLEHSAKVRHSRPAVDVLFQSASETFRDRVIGVVLTGGDHDGTDGMKAITATGGVRIVQSPSDAVDPAMPCHAMPCHARQCHRRRRTSVHCSARRDSQVARQAGSRHARRTLNSAPGTMCSAQGPCWHNGAVHYNRPELSPTTDRNATLNFALASTIRIAIHARYALFSQSTPRMQPHIHKQPSKTAAVAFDLLDPIAFGFFVGALIFDAIYTNSAEVMWFKAAAWLISIGLVVAIIPRLINLVQVWFPRVRPTPARYKIAFWLNLLGIVAAIVNAFVHSRDAYAVVPDGVWLSALTVALLVGSHVVLTLQYLQTEIGSRA